MRRRVLMVMTCAGALSALVLLNSRGTRAVHAADDPVNEDAQASIQEGRKTFRFDTFGDQAFWGDMLRLHQAIEGAALGGVGPGLSPRMALALGLKVDAQAIPHGLLEQIAAGRVNLDDAATTLALVKLQAVVGLTGFFNQNGSLQSVGIQCALCHST